MGEHSTSVANGNGSNELPTIGRNASTLEQGGQETTYYSPDSDESDEEEQTEEETSAQLEEMAEEVRDYLTSLERPAQDLDLSGISPYKFFLAGSFEPIVFDNLTSEARDLDMNERNFLSSIRTSLYLGLAGCVVMANFRFPGKPFDRTDIIEQMSLPVGIIFMVFAFIGLYASANNYVRSICSYAKQRSVVKTTRTSHIFIFGSALAILATNIVLLISM